MPRPPSLGRADLSKRRCLSRARTRAGRVPGACALLLRQRSRTRGSAAARWRVARGIVEQVREALRQAHRVGFHP